MRQQKGVLPGSYTRENTFFLGRLKHLRLDAVLSHR